MDIDDDPAGDSLHDSDALAQALDGAIDANEATDAIEAIEPIDADPLRLLSRSPHPYHHNNADLPHAAHRIAHHHPPLLPPALLSSSAFGKDSAPASDSGTEADDEHFLKGLPAPRPTLRKGLRGMNEVLSGISTPLLSPAYSLSDRDGPPSSSAAGPTSRRQRQQQRQRQGQRAAGPTTAQDCHGDSESVACSMSVFGDDDDDNDTGGRRRPFPTTPSSARPPRSAPNAPPSQHAQKHNHKRDAALLDIRDKDRRQGRGSAERSRRRREVVRRSTELVLLVSLAALLVSNPSVRPLLFHWRFELQAVTAIVVGLLVLYPVRLAVWAYRNSSSSSSSSQRIGVPASFDPAPLYYPLAIPVLVSFLLATPTLPVAPLLNLVLSVCVLPKQLIPLSANAQLYDPVQWALSCVPVFVAAHLAPSAVKNQAMASSSPVASMTTSSPPPPFGSLSPETAVLLYPLHQTLCWLLHDLTTTSLLPAELQLLSVALINLLVLAMSPQAVILQALLWGGSLSLLVFGSSVVRWGIMLARIPRWRFRREQDAAAAASAKKKSYVATLLHRAWSELMSLRRARVEMMYGPYSAGGGTRLRSRDTGHQSGDSSDDVRQRQRKRQRKLGPAMVVHERVGSLSVSEHDDEKPVPLLVQRWQQHTAHITVTRDDVGSCVEEAVGDHPGEPEINNTDGIQELPPHAWMVPTMATERNHHTKPPAPTTTPSGRRKRAPSMTARAFFSLTHAQAVRRKWLYAGVLYAGIAVTILGILRPYIGAYALRGREPFGWALGYLLGGFDGFRLEVVKANLEHWVCLPPRPPPTLDACLHCHAGWVEHVRQTWLGAATTRLVLFGYWGLVIVFGLTVVFTLSPIYEVDTRRKVFHFMMVAVLLPATFVDPAFAGLALALVLSVFLLLDLLRASQLPPLSRPIATFLTPYVDGRDLRGPVVISHIFLLIGCAIPLWLSLASLPRTFSSSGSDDCTTGWEVPTRDVSMVAGVICVGLGDAAASLIGRRWGRRKWVWGGGKSLEGSVAFATAVFAGTMAASLWLRVGGWPVTGEDVVPLPLASDMTAGSLDRTVAWIGGRAAQAVAPRAGVCAVVASLTEAVLTGGNDNVVVPVILWTCVKSFGL